ncbi:DinB family protein [Micromonospora sp. CA-240977]|uniref:DinB family protein n=1 Tax=Micromonospora sp. CA-240977 TaxID=3239957 RepID=UPI003D94745E
MSTRNELLIDRFEQLNADLVAFVRDLSTEGLSAPSANGDGSTVGDEIAHLAKGAPEVLGWLVRTTDTGAPAPQHLHSHPHPHPHQHGSGQHENGAADGDLLAGMQESLGGAVDVLRKLTDEQLDVVPPAAPGITDGTKSLYQIVDMMIDHQGEHLTHMRSSVAGRPGQAPA